MTIANILEPAHRLIDVQKIIPLNNMAKIFGMFKPKAQSLRAYSLGFIGLEQAKITDKHKMFRPIVSLLKKLKVLRYIALINRDHAIEVLHDESQG